MKLPIRKIKNVWLRRAAIVVLSILTVPVALLLSIIGIVSESICAAWGAGKEDYRYWMSKHYDLYRNIKNVWSKDFKNE